MLVDTSGRIRKLEQDQASMENEVLLSDEQATRLAKQPLKKRKNWMRNRPCPCESGRKFKNCCWSKMARAGKST